jgi:hypothetical protein
VARWSFNGEAVSGGGENGEGKQGVREMKGAAAPIHFATGGEGVLCVGGEQAVAVLGREKAGSLKVEEDDKGSRLSGPRCWAQSKNGPEDLMGHHGRWVEMDYCDGSPKNMKGKPEITYGLQRSTGQIEMGQERKNIIVSQFSDSRKWDRNQKF